MFQLDNKFLEDIGLGDLPEDDKKSLLLELYRELELRVGTELSKGLSEQQMREFEAFVDRDEPKVRAWFDKNLPNYHQAKDFVQLQANAPAEVEEIVLISEYGSLKWLEMNRPDYRQVVAAELEKLKAEMLQKKDTILGSDAQAA